MAQERLLLTKPCQLQHNKQWVPGYMSVYQTTVAWEATPLSAAPKQHFPAMDIQGREQTSHTMALSDSNLDTCIVCLIYPDDNREAVHCIRICQDVACISEFAPAWQQVGGCPLSAAGQKAAKGKPLLKLEMAVPLLLQFNSEQDRAAIVDAINSAKPSPSKAAAQGSAATGAPAAAAPRPQTAAAKSAAVAPHSHPVAASHGIPPVEERTRILASNMYV